MHISTFWKTKKQAKNLGFCIKLFNYVVLFAQATFNASAGYMPVSTIFLFASTLDWLLFYIIKFYLGMDISCDTVLTKKLLLVTKSFAVSICPAAIFLSYVINSTPSDAESHEEQDGSKQKFVVGMTAKL